MDWQIRLAILLFNLIDCWNRKRFV
jgi:hypothetical protein